MSRLLTAVHTAPSGAMASPVPLRTPVANGSAGPPPGGTRMTVARGGVAARSSAEMLPVDPIEKYTAPSGPTATLLSACAVGAAQVGALGVGQIRGDGPAVGWPRRAA